MSRPVTSDVSALSGFVAKGHQAIHTFPLPPLKFRTVGFPQYGFKRAASRDLRRLAEAWSRAPTDEPARLAWPSPILSGLGNHNPHTTGPRVAG
jgi:hypothetical protein